MNPKALFLLLLSFLISAPQFSMANSCLTWFEKTFSANYKAKMELSQKLKVPEAQDPIKAFYDNFRFYKDPKSKAYYQLPGRHRLSLWFFKGQPIRSFHILSEDKLSSERLGFYQGKVVVLKIFEHPEVWEGHVHTFESRLRTEVELISYIQQQQLAEVVPVIDHSVKDRIILKEFIPGYPLGRIDSRTQAVIISEPTIASISLDGAISGQDYELIKKERDKLYNRMEQLNTTTNSFKIWARQNRLIAFIDLAMPQSTLYWNGRWYINSPYPLY